MPKNSRASRNPIVELQDEAIGSETPDVEAAIDVVTEARGEVEPETGDESQDESQQPLEVEVGEPSRESSGAAPTQKPKRMTKAEALAEVERLNVELQATRQKAQSAEARLNVEAVNNLGAVMAMALKVGSQIVAAQRGSHWVLRDDEATPMGEAWAVVAAPYADKLGKALPWALAIGVTWKAIAPRLEQDKLMVVEHVPSVATPE